MNLYELVILYRVKTSIFLLLLLSLATSCRPDKDKKTHPPVMIQKFSENNVPYQFGKVEFATKFLVEKNSKDQPALYMNPDSDIYRVQFEFLPQISAAYSANKGRIYVEVGGNPNGDTRTTNAQIADDDEKDYAVRLDWSWTTAKRLSTIESDLGNTKSTYCEYTVFEEIDRQPKKTFHIRNWYIRLSNHRNLKVRVASEIGFEHLWSQQQEELTNFLDSFVINL